MNRLARPLALGLALVAASACAARSPQPCTSSDRCGPGRTCASGRCVAIGSEAAPPDGRRLLVAPTEMAVVSPEGRGGTLPNEIAFGGVGSSIVLLRFPTPWGNRLRIASAFLTLDPPPEGSPSTEPVEIRVTRVLEPWSADDVSWARLPRLSPLEGRALAISPRTVRIDVTSIVQGWTSGRTGEHGIALVSSSSERGPATYGTGVSGGRAPRLDVYLR